MKKKLLTIAVCLGMISAGSWSMITPIHAAQHRSQTNYQHVSESKVDNDREVNDDQKEVENGPRSEVERHEAKNLPGGGHADKHGINVEHQFEGEE